MKRKKKLPVAVLSLCLYLKSCVYLQVTGVGSGSLSLARDERWWEDDGDSRPAVRSLSPSHLHIASFFLSIFFSFSASFPVSSSPLYFYFWVPFHFNRFFFFFVIYNERLLTGVQVPNQHNLSLLSIRPVFHFVFTWVNGLASETESFGRTVRIFKWFILYVAVF